MQYILSVELDEPDEILAFMQWIKFQSKRLNCSEKDVFTKLGREYQAQMVGNNESGNNSKEKKKATAKA